MITARAFCTALALGIAGNAALLTTASAESPAFTAIPLMAHSAGTYYVNARIGETTELDLLVDTGSSYLVLGEATLQTLLESGDAELSRQVSGGMADGRQRVVSLYRLRQLHLGDRCTVEGVEAAVIPGNQRPILGMNALRQLAPFTLATEPAQLSVARCNTNEVLPVADAKAPAPTVASAGAP